MSNPRPPASELLPLLAAAFPHTFFADPKQVQPLKINIHHDLDDLRKAQALPAEIGLLPLRRFLHWYTQRTCYRKALARGLGRVDLIGAVVDTDIPQTFATRRNRKSSAGNRIKRRVVRPDRQARRPRCQPWQRPFPKPSLPSRGRYNRSRRSCTVICSGLPRPARCLTASTDHS